MRQAHTSLIRRQLFALLMVLCVPCVAVLALTGARQSAHDRETAGRKMLAAATLTAARLDDHASDLIQLLSTLAVVVGTQPSDIARNDALLRDLADHLPAHIANLDVWAADGSNVGALRPRTRSAGMTVAHRSFFRDAADRGGLAVEAPLMATRDGPTIGEFGIRIERDGRFAGVVAVAARLQDLQNLLDPKGTLPPGTLVTVVDPRGIVLARSGEVGRAVDVQTLPAPAMPGIRPRGDGVREVVGHDGVQRIDAFTTAARVPWTVSVSQPTALALGASRARLVDQAAIGGVLMIVGLLVAHAIAGRIAGPLRQLERDATVLEGGELSHRTTVAGSGEIGSLAASFNRMAASLEQRTRALAASEERLRRMAQYDPLTGLPNRSLFMERLSARIDEAAQSRRGFAVLSLDVDHFKAVNDALGHRAGDDVLVGLARVLEHVVGPQNPVARLGGDEFMVILQAVDDLDEASTVAQSLVEAMRGTVGIGKRAIRVTASVGIAMSEHDESGQALLNRAGEALHLAKRMGRDRARVAFRVEHRVLDVAAGR